MVYSDYTKQRILFYSLSGQKSTTIAKSLEDEGIKVSVSGVCRLLLKYRESGTIARRPGSGRPTKITTEILKIVEEQMQQDDETTAIQLQKILFDKGCPLALQTILTSRKKVGWTFRGSAYCQIIRQENKVKRLNWARLHLQEALNDKFEDVLWSHEASVMLESHRRFCCRKRNTQAKPKPRAKHPCKVHVWAGISWTGKTPIVIFEGKMNGAGYIEVLESGLIPYLDNQ